MHARQLLHAAIKENEVVHQLDKSMLLAQLEQVLVELEAGVVLLVFLPLEKHFLRSANRAELQPLGIVAGENELHRAEEPLIEIGLLVRQALPDTVADRHAALL